jgi:uncharacterized membrane protein YgdD (TMEM256/DUF423 family)
MNAITAYRISAGLGFLAVALGAFGAHGLKDILQRNGTTEIWETAALYHLVHAAVSLMVAGQSPEGKPWAHRAWWLFFAGILVFSGSLYALALSNVRVLGAITPLGGLGLLGGWLALVFRRAS